MASFLQGGHHHPTPRSWQNEGRNLRPSQLIYEIKEGSLEIKALPGQKRWSVAALPEFLTPLVAKGLQSVLLFGVVSEAKKDPKGSAADAKDTPVIQAIQILRKTFPQLYIIADVCLCEYTSHGHCGLIYEDKRLKQKESDARIAEVALNYVKAGAHCVAPSDMMDNRIGAIKQALIGNNDANKACLMAYSAKFASCMYGPFREAAGSVPNFGDRKCYQLPPASRGLARRAIERDIAAGADIVMVKPAMPYLDVMRDAKNIAPGHALACYQVSGEFAMIHAAANVGSVDLKTAVLESMDCFQRAGANIIITYFVPELLEWL